MEPFCLDPVLRCLQGVRYEMGLAFKETDSSRIVSRSFK
jgi:hypothetical protein